MTKIKIERPDENDYMINSKYWAKIKELFKDGDITNMYHMIKNMDEYIDFFLDDFYSKYIEEIILELPLVTDVSNNDCEIQPIKTSFGCYKYYVNYDVKINYNNGLPFYFTIQVPFDIITNKDIEKLKKIILTDCDINDNFVNREIYKTYKKAKKGFDKLDNNFVKKMALEELAKTNKNNEPEEDEIKEGE